MKPSDCNDEDSMPAYLGGRMKGERFYIVETGHALLIIGWDKDHEPTTDNECGYLAVAGPFASKAEADHAFRYENATYHLGPDMAEDAGKGWKP